jgi:hypothetical protein
MGARATEVAGSSGAVTPMTMARAQHRAGDTTILNGEGGNRTRDTTIFSRVLYQLSYLAARGDGSGTTAAGPLI